MIPHSSILCFALFLCQAGTPLEQFRGATSLPAYQRMRIIGESVAGKNGASAEAVQELLEAAIKDGDPSVRREAVSSIANVLYVNAMPAVPDAMKWAVRLRLIAGALRADLELAARDDDASVRYEALRGIVASSAASNPAAPLPPELVKRLVGVFDRDPSAHVRSLVVGALKNNYASTDPEARKLATHVLLRALEDPDPFVVQYAGNAAWSARCAESVPFMVRQLKNPSPVARLGVSIGLQGYPEEARAYLHELQTTLASEPDGPTRKTLEATISKIKSGR